MPVFVKRTRPVKKPFRGWTNADGSKTADCPAYWPFGTAPVVPPPRSTAKPKVRKP